MPAARRRRRGRHATSTPSIRSARTSTTRATSTRKWRIPGGGQISGGVAVERERLKSCTAPDDPNYVTATANVFNGVALCDDFALDIPWRPQFKMSARREIGCGINVSMSFQNNSSPTSSRLMTVTRSTTRYPANCPSPCPAGEIIMPTAAFPARRR